MKNMDISELEMIEDVAEYQRALIMGFEAGEISAEKLKTGIYASKALLDTLTAIKANSWEFPFE